MQVADVALLAAEVHVTGADLDFEVLDFFFLEEDDFVLVFDVDLQGVEVLLVFAFQVVAVAHEEGVLLEFGHVVLVLEGFVLVLVEDVPDGFGFVVFGV